jgi:hypothetical protein
MDTVRTASRTALLAAAALLGVSTVAQAASAPTARVATKTFATNVAPLANGEITLPYSQVVSMACRPNERAISPGIASATHYLTAQSFGPAAVSSIVVGPKGRAVSRLQALCLRNGRVVNRRVEGRLVPGISGSGFGRVTARAACPRGFVASGAPLSQDYAPGFGAFTSVPQGPRGWRVVVDRAPDGLAATSSPGAFADVACVKARGASVVVKRGTIAASGALSITATCGRGRALGWGVDLGAYTQRMTSFDGRWATPIVTRAAFTSARRMAFQFRLPAGADAASGAGTPVSVHLVCGIPVR